MTSKETIKRVLYEQQKLFKEKYTERTLLKTLKKKSESDFIIIISGIRRCGKSVLLNQFKKTQKEKSYYVNFDDERLIDFQVSDFEKLHEILIELYGEEKTFYFDEIQNISGWETFVRRLHDYKNKIYITGSNAKLLSKELGTRLTGRHIKLELYPASFKEYLKFNKITLTKTSFYEQKQRIKIKQLMETYIKKGGFFKYLQTKDEDYFKNLYENILYRDIITRHSLNHEKGIKDLFNYLVSNASKEFSYETLKKITNISSTTTIKDYITYLEDSYLLFTTKLYDISIKKQLINPKKAYVIDPGLANKISFKFSEDKGRLLENIIFLELKRQNKEIYYHRKKHECDFIIKEKNKITEAIQVTWELNINNKEREIKGIIEAMKEHKLTEGTIITLEEEETITIDKKIVRVIPAWKWLCND